MFSCVYFRAPQARSLLPEVLTPKFFISLHQAQVPKNTKK